MVRSAIVSVILLTALVSLSTYSQEKKAPSQAGGPIPPITVHVSKSGLFSGFAHNHVITAPVATTKIDRQSMAAEIVVNTKDMKVADPEVSDKDRAEIQSTMLGPKVLDAEKFPEIRFTSSRIEAAGPHRYHVSGKLQLHGASREIAFDISESAGRFRGQTKLKQTDFGVQPVSIAGGTVKVKDEIEIEFNLESAPAVSGK